MADNVSLTPSIDGITEHLENMLSRSKLTSGWLNRVAYPALIRAQRVRWQTEGVSEGAKWEPIKATTARYKLKKFASFPGGGRKLLIATNRLVMGMTGDNQGDHYKLVTDRKLEFGTIVPYAKYVNETRDIIDFSAATLERLMNGLNKYILQGAS